MPDEAAAAGETPVAAAADEAAGIAAEAAAAAPPKNDYSIEYYGKGNKNSIGIKAKFGAKGQILSFGSTRCTKTAKEMTEIARVIVADLHSGMCSIFKLIIEVHDV